MSNGPKLIQSIERAASILKCFEDNTELGVTEISLLTKLHKSTAFNIIVTLEHLGALEQNPINGKYKLGIEMFRLGAKVDSNIRTIAKPYMEKLVVMYSESVNLVVRNDMYVVYIDKTESPQPVRLGTEVGMKLPLYCPAVGKAILSTLPKDELNNILDNCIFTKFTENTVSSKDELLLKLDLVKKNGYSIDIEEWEYGLAGVAASIRDNTGRANYAISVAGPKYRMDINKLTTIGQTLVEITNEISKKALL